MDVMKVSEGKRIGSSRADIVLWGYSRIESDGENATYPLTTAAATPLSLE